MNNNNEFFNDVIVTSLLPWCFVSIRLVSLANIG